MYCFFFFLLFSASHFFLSWCVWFCFGFVYFFSLLFCLYLPRLPSAFQRTSCTLLSECVLIKTSPSLFLSVDHRGGQQPLAHKQETGRSPFGNRTEGPVARQGTVLTLEDPADTVEGGGTFSFGTVLIDGSRKGKTKKGIGAATAAATGALSARGAATVLSVSPREVSSGEERGEAAGEAEGEGEEQRSSSAQSSGEGSGGSAKERLTVEEKMGETRKLQLRVLAGLGKVYRLKLTFQRAYELHRRQLHLAETIYGKESEEVSDALYQLAFACDELNKTEELLHCDRQCFQVRGCKRRS